MVTKVLVFESDPAFAGELRSELGKLGCSTVVVDDGNLGLQQAVSERPDLILLAIELPRMNGFSVCNKLKKDPGLKDVPLIIMSTESSDETFEQHKKLRTRAEDYVHKPIAFGQLLQHIQEFVALSPGMNDSDTVILIDDEIEIGSTDYVGDDSGSDVSREIPLAEATSRRIEAAVDADVDAFAESAFGRLTGPDAAQRVPPNGAPTMDSTPAVAHSVPPRPPSVRPGVDPMEHERVCRELARVKVRFDEVDRAFDDMRGEVDTLRVEAAESERRGREIEELKSKIANTKGAAVSSRDFLDLREALNKKDKEILTLKEGIAKKDRQIVEAQDRSLAAERAHSEVDDRLLSLERELDETKEKNESLSADRDLAKKASDDFRTRLEKARTENETRERQLAELRARHADELMAVEESSAAMRADLDQILANERAEHARALDQSEERRKADLDRTKREHEGQLATAQGEWELELSRLRAEAERHEQSALDELRAEFQAKGAREVAEANDKAARLAQELGMTREEMGALRKGKDELDSKMAVAESRAASLEADLATTQQELAEVKHRLGVQSSRADKAQAKWQADRQSLERAKDALAVALAQIEEAEERQVE
jgi:CheY-like chemotaxis protein/chromosome segregation ATPase